MTACRLRPFRPGDGMEMSALYRTSVETLGPRHYSPDQVKAWASLTPAPERFETLAGNGRLSLIAEDAEGRMAGFADLEPDGHIHYLYCAPSAAGTGCAAQLIAAIQENARDRGMARLHSEASEGAKGVFVRAGFTVLHRRELRIGAVGIHNYAVEKVLG